MTKKQLEKFIKTRNRSRFNSNMQFMIDAQSCGFKESELGEARRVLREGGVWVFEWDTPHGLMVERNGRLYLEAQEMKAAC
jgi:hypothetical protein